MISLDSIVQLVETYGLWLIFVLAIIEGPIVTVIAAYVSALGRFDIYAVYALLVVADLVGDMIYYVIGRLGPRWLSPCWQARLGLSQQRLSSLEQHFDGHGGKTLVIGKLTHSAGLFILVAAGVSKMPVGRFLLFNLIGTLPKTAAFMAIGYSLGYAYQTIDSYIFRTSLVILVIGALIALIWLLRKRRKSR
ncbi:MAG: DedA family protein [Alphaproteobacteria bacterium]|nr:DedA family protein [Alphaproteobacteria bacterium]